VILSQAAAEKMDLDLEPGGVHRHKVRRLFPQIWVKKMGYSSAEAARFLAVTTFAVNRLAASKETDEVKIFICVVSEPTSIYTSPYIKSLDRLRL